MDAGIYSTYFDLEENHWWFRGRRRIIEAVLKTIFPRRVAYACDIGCGAGENLPLLAEVAHDVCGLEMSHAAAARARRNYPAFSITEGIFPDVIPAGTFDLVTLFDVLEHIEDDGAALASIRERLAPGGLLMLTVPAHPFLWSAHDDIVHHKRRYTKHTLNAALRAAGFAPIRVTYFNALLFIPTVLFRLLKRGLSRTPSSDLFAFPKPVNAALTAVFGAERFVLRYADIPFGVSLLAVARKTS